MSYKKNSQYMSSARRKDWSHYKDEVVLNFIPQTHTYRHKYNLLLCDHANSGDVREHYRVQAHCKDAGMYQKVNCGEGA